MGLFDFLRNKGNKQKEESAKSPDKGSQDDFVTDMANTADSFVSRTSQKYPGLDFSVKSLTVIDTILEDASDFYEDMSEDQKQGLVNSTGSYIFEVARRNYGGRYFWYDQLNQPILVTGQPNFEASILAFEKVKGRLENGKEDNIPFYFAGYIERVQNKQSGMIV